MIICLDKWFDNPNRKCLKVTYNKDFDCSIFSLPSSKALSDLHIDDLLEPEGYDTLPGLFLSYLCIYTPKALSTQKGD